jgi:hypothetical protein
MHIGDGIRLRRQLHGILPVRASKRTENKHKEQKTYSF